MPHWNQRSAATPLLQRTDRHVRQSFVRVQGAVSRERIAQSMEQALRFVELPGEAEGRIYCFRRVRVGEIDARGTQSHWTEAIQHRLEALAATAVPGFAPGAEQADAIYFNNLQQALTWFLRLEVSGAEKLPWFVESLAGVDPGAPRAARVTALLEATERPPVPPGAGPVIVLAALGDSHPAPLLEALPEPFVRAWLRTWESAPQQAPRMVPVELETRLRVAVERAAEHFGWRAPHTLWLTLQCVRATALAAAAGGIALERARATLSSMEASAGERKTTSDQTQASPVAELGWRLVFEHNSGENLNAPAGPQDRLPQPAPEAGARPGAAAADVPARMRPDVAEPPLAPFAILGEATHAGGLYFLLAVLRHLGIAETVQRCPALEETDFAGHILRRLALACGVAENDAALTFLTAPLGSFPAKAEILSSAGAEARVDIEALAARLKSCPVTERETERIFPQQLWPANASAWLESAARTSPEQFEARQHWLMWLVRLWSLAVRRWCWRMGRLTLAEIVLRPGRVVIEGSELDIVMPLECADVRIRRLGLDIDPGWVPWLGPSGSMVRFHYRDRDGV